MQSPATPAQTPAATCTPAMTHAEIVAACLAAVNDRDPRIVAALDIIETAFNDLSRTNDLATIAPAALQHVYDALCTLEPEIVDPHGRIIFEAIALIESTFRNIHSSSYAYQAFNALEDVEIILSRPSQTTVSQPAPVQACPA